MPFSLTGLRTRLRSRVDSAARGSDIPAGIERGETSDATGSRERGRMRRHLRELRRLREARLLELGALMLEAHRQDRDDSPVIKRKAADAAALDAEARAIGEALGTGTGGLDTIVAAGVAGPCPACSTLVSTSARFCSTCGTALDGRPEPAPAEAAPAEAAAPAEPAAATTEIHVPNGDGTTPDETELETTAGGDR